MFRKKAEAELRVRLFSGVHVIAGFRNIFLVTAGLKPGTRFLRDRLKEFSKLVSVSRKASKSFLFRAAKNCELFSAIKKKILI
jgi:hypothetical protein